MPKFRVTRPVTAPVAIVRPEPVVLTLHERRAHAAARVLSLMLTSIPTRDLLDSYLDEVLQP